MAKAYLIVPLGLFVLCSCGPQRETILIPQGFAGRVNIIFRQQNGAPPKYENGRRVYEIPSNGLLLTQFKDEYGLIDQEYYFVDSAGKRTRLRSFSDSVSGADRDVTGIYLEGTTGQFGTPPNAVWWQEFVVSSYNSLDRFFAPAYKKQFENRLRKATGVEVVIP